MPSVLYGKEEERIYLSGSFFSLVSHLVKFAPCEFIPLYFQIALSSSLVGCPLGIPDPTPCGVVFHPTLEVMEGDELWELASWPSSRNSQKRLTEFVSDTVFHILITKCKPSSHLSI